MTNYFVYGSIVLVPIFAFALAKGSRAFGRQFALARLTNTDNVADTIDRQVRVAGHVGLMAVAFVVAVLALLFFAPSGSASWAQFLGSVVSFAANLALGLAAGIGGNAADLLAKVSARDTIDVQVEMKRRLRRRLAKFLGPVLLALLLTVGSGMPASAAETVWAWLIDITDSMDPAQREAATEAMAATALDNAHRLSVDAIVVVKFSDEDLLSDMTWIPVPAAHRFDDCRSVTPSLRISKSWVTFSPTLLADAKQEAIKACFAHQASERVAASAEAKGFAEQLQQATRSTPRADVSTRIVPLLQTFVGRPYVRAVDLVTDLQDQSGVSPDDLRIPDATSVIIVVTRPNPRRSTPTLRQVLAAAEHWSRIKGLTVTSAAEYPGCVQFAKGR